MKSYLPRKNTFVMLMAAIALFNVASLNAQTKLERVHNMAHSVMPFDMAKTMHIFKMTESGGVQMVVVKDLGYVNQIKLIQHHLHMESEKFQHGDYSDPASLHGADMPGLKELEIGASSIKVSYTALPNGAEITFETSDLHLLTALHRCFGAQLSEHGADARAE
jgi:hypothetical protein